jgi:hypothetical protein
MPSSLKIQVGPLAGRTIEVTAGQSVSVGATDKSDIVIGNDSTLASPHFVLEGTSEGCRVRSAGSNTITISGKPSQEAFLREGDTLQAGKTIFDVFALLDCTPLKTLQSQALPVFGVLDAARDKWIRPALQSSGEQYQSLYEGPKGDALAEVAPYLVLLPPGSALLRALADQHWGASFGIYLTSRLPFLEIRKHFRRLMIVKSEDDRKLYFRFYDPRVLRVYLPTCSPPDAATFFGPIRHFFVESEDPSSYFRFGQKPAGIHADLIRTSESRC